MWTEYKRLTKLPPGKKKKKKETKIKADVLKQVFASIPGIIQELWLQQNTNWHKLNQEQIQIANLTEATKKVTYVYSLRSFIIAEHNLQYFAMDLSERIKQSTSGILPQQDENEKFTTVCDKRRWKLHSVRCWFGYCWILIDQINQ